MALRAKNGQLGDVHGSRPEGWVVGGLNTPPLHAMLLLFARDEAELETQRARHLERLGRIAGLFEGNGVHVESGAMLEGDREHFGYRDGIANPAVAGSGAKVLPGQTCLRAGEFVLGYADEYELLPLSPSVFGSEDPRDLLPVHPIDSDRKDLGRNGTYLVFRKLKQDVAEFWSYFKQQNPDEKEATRLASKVVGRWPSGCPLALSPDHDDEGIAADENKNNDFRYRVDDPEGYKCPAAAHVRRANPRDDIVIGQPKGEKVTKRHRIRRRSTCYGPPLAPYAEDDGIERGLLFLCTNTDLARQFELVNRWSFDPTFNGLENTDPLYGGLKEDGDQEAKLGTMLIPGKPIRQRLAGMEQFVSTKGGGYFFMGSIRFLKYMASR